MASAEAKAVDAKMRAIQDSADPNQQALNVKARGQQNRDLSDIPHRDQKASDQQFPTSGFVSRDDKKDELISAKFALQDATHPGVTPFGQLIAKDEDFQWLQRKQEQQEYANFQQWFAENFDKMSPEQKKIARELFPTFYNERLQQLDRSVELQRRIARLKLMGIQDKNDMLFQYALESGYVPSDPLRQIMDPKAVDDTTRKARYRRGILNPRRLLHGDFGITTRRVNAVNATGRKEVTGGPAFYGITDPGTATLHGFSAGNTTDVNEHLAGSKSLLGGIDPYMGK